jgi:ribosome recycling factor
MTAPEIEQLEARMTKALDALRRDLHTLRTGRANPGMLDGVQVEMYGSTMPLNQLCTVTAPEPRLLVLTPWDKGALQAIEKALLKSDLGLTPNSDGQVIRLNIPQLTEERRKELIKHLHKRTEEARVEIRHHRREFNDTFKKKRAAHEIGEDEEKRMEEMAQKSTDKFIAEIDKIQGLKEAELMEV